MEWSVQSVALIVAVAIDLLFRELPNRWHPVAWMGTWIAASHRGVSHRSLVQSKRYLPLTAGLILVATGAVACGILGWQIEVLSLEFPFIFAAILQGIVLKQTFSIKSLARAAGSVEMAIREGDLPAARRELAFHLVSRDVAELNESQVAAATIESVAENASDSIVAPLFYFAIAGLPGALIYRFVNTCDAMIGYRTEKFEWLGKPAARLDDLLNLIPARLSAALILAMGGVIYRRPVAGLLVWLRDRRATASPNAGQPMSAAAGALGVELEKLGHYRLGCGQRSPRAADIGRAIRMLWGASLLAAVAAFVGLLCKGGI